MASGPRIGAGRAPCSRTLAMGAAALVAGSCALQTYTSVPLDADAAVVDFTARNLEQSELVAFARARLPAGRAFPPARWDLDSLTLAALFYRRDLDVARADLAAARSGVTSAGARPNPTLVVDPEVVPGAPHPWIFGVALDLTLETAGKRRLRVRSAEAQEWAAKIDLLGVAWDVRRSVRAARDEVRAAAAERAAVETEAGIRRSELAVLSDKLAAGDASRIDLLASERAASELALELEAARRREERARSRLAEALAVPRSALEGILLAEPESELTPAPEAMEARDLGLPNRLDLRRARAEYAAAEAELALQIARQRPDLHLMPGTSWDQGDHKYAIGFALELPIFHKGEGPIGVASARRDAAAARFLALQDAALGSIETARLRYAGALRERAAGQASVRLALGQERLLEEELVAGAAGRLELIAARMERARLERAAAALDAAAARAAAALEQELGRPLAAPIPLDSVEDPPRTAAPSKAQVNA